MRHDAILRGVECARVEHLIQTMRAKVRSHRVMTQEPQFTPQAAHRWSELDGSLKMRLLNNAWCVACRNETTIVHFTGRVNGGSLVLEGCCIKCDGRVARVIEGE